MEPAILLFCLVAAPVYVHSTIQLVESGPGRVSPGGSFRLTCKVTGESIEYVPLSWIRQTPRKGLEWVGDIVLEDGEWTTNYASSLQSRTTLTADDSKNECYLTMRSLTAADSATYFCAEGAVYDSWGSWAFEYWGKGTSVVVSSEPPKAPSVFPLSPSGQNGVAFSPPSQISIGCLIKNYFPEPAKVQWNSGAITSGIHNFPPVLHPSGQYTHTSLLTIPFSKWESETFHCTVEHAATNSRINKNIKRCEAHEPVSPEVHLLHSSCNLKGSDGAMELVCHIGGFYPKEIIVEWLVGSHHGLLTPYTEPPRRDVNKYTFSTVSRVNITQADWLEGNTYYCQVTHAASQTQVKDRARKCEDASSHFSTDVTAYLLPPRPKDLYINRNARLVCVVVNLQQEEGLKITWLREKNVAMHPELVVVTEENNGTFTAVGHCPVSALAWESGETFTCSVEYPGLPGPIVNAISKSREKSKAPSIHIYHPIPGNSLTLTCFIRGFFPAENHVQWLKNGNAISEDDYVNTPAVKEKRNESFFLYSKLTIPTLDWDSGSLFSCMVVHEALEQKFTQKSIGKTSGKR